MGSARDPPEEDRHPTIPAHPRTEGGLTVDDERGVARRRVVVVNAYGLHMRPAGKFVGLANSFSSEVRVDSGETKVNGKSILDMVGLAAECGSTLDLEA